MIFLAPFIELAVILTLTVVIWLLVMSGIRHFTKKGEDSSKSGDDKH
jgi:hypothetical protein